jgi:uncharacterized membrane protein
MSVYEKGLITILGCILLFVLLAIPLILRKVPRNVVYGYRTRATLSNDYVWYEANAHFGRGFLIANVIAAIAVLVLYRTQYLSPAFFLKASIVALVAPVLVAVFATSRFIRTLMRDDSARHRPR